MEKTKRSKKRPGLVHFVRFVCKQSLLIGTKYRAVILCLLQGSGLILPHTGAFLGKGLEAGVGQKVVSVFL